MEREWVEFHKGQKLPPCTHQLCCKDAPWLNLPAEAAFCEEHKEIVTELLKNLKEE